MGTQGIPAEEWLTRPELAKRWKKSTATLATWAAKGFGPRYALIGRSARYRLSDVIAFEQLAFETTRPT